MIVVDILKIICLILLCVYSSLTDIKRGIVKNKIIIISITIGLALNFAAWVAFDSNCLLRQLVNIFIVDLIAIILYTFRIWAGGDCKLTFAITLLIPYCTYMSILNDWVSMVAMLGITFGVSYIYLICDSIACAIRKKHHIDKKKLFQKIKMVISRWISCVAYITLVDFIVLRLLPDLLIPFVFVINICLILIVSGANILRNKYVVAGVIVAGVALKIIFHQQVFDKFIIINYSLAVLFIVLRLFIDEYNYETIETSQVEKGMILSLATTIQFVNSRVQGLPHQSTEDLRSRLSEEEAQAVHRWEKSKYGTSTVQIVKKLPFAIFISIGAILFVILGATV